MGESARQSFCKLKLRTVGALSDHTAAAKSEKVIYLEVELCHLCLFQVKFYNSLMGGFTLKRHKKHILFIGNAFRVSPVL